MFRIPRPLVLLTLLTACALVPGCMFSGQDRPMAGTMGQTVGIPGVTITSPADGAVLPAGDITVSVRVTNFTLVPEYGRPYVAGEGHLHYSMGMGVPEPGASSSSVAPISYAATTATSYTWPDIPAGTYTFMVELANNDHSPFPGPVSSSVTLKVTGSLPATTGLTTPGGGEDPRSCVTDSDCVSEQCCHPTTCINRAYKGVCTLLCTNVCQGPLDCGAGHCGCVDGKCSVVSGSAPAGP